MLLNAVEFLYTLECVFQSPHLSLINSQDLGEHVDHNNRDLKLVWKGNYRSNGLKLCVAHRIGTLLSYNTCRKS